jgi:hypothetical protein
MLWILLPIHQAPLSLLKYSYLYLEEAHGGGAEGLGPHSDLVEVIAGPHTEGTFIPYSFGAHNQSVTKHYY